MWRRGFQGLEPHPLLLVKTVLGDDVELPTECAVAQRSDPDLGSAAAAPASSRNTIRRQPNRIRDMTISRSLPLPLRVPPSLPLGEKSAITGSSDKSYHLIATGDITPGPSAKGSRVSGSAATRPPNPCEIVKLIGKFYRLIAINA